MQKTTSLVLKTGIFRRHFLKIGFFFWERSRIGTPTPSWASLVWRGSRKFNLTALARVRARVDLLFPTLRISVCAMKCTVKCVGAPSTKPFALDNMFQMLHCISRDFSSQQMHLVFLQGWLRKLVRLGVRALKATCILYRVCIHSLIHPIPQETDIRQLGLFSSKTRTGVNTQANPQN